MGLRNVSRVVRSIAIALVPVAIAYALMLATTNPDEGANIGGGILVLFSIPIGLGLGGAYLVRTGDARRVPIARWVVIPTGTQSGS